MKILVRTGLALAMFLALAVPTSLASAAVSDTVRIRVPLDGNTWNPCALENTGEYVALDGTVQEVWHTVIDGNGGAHVSAHLNIQGGSGVGLTSGKKYRFSATGLMNQSVKVGETYSYLFEWRVVGPGHGNNYFIREEHGHYTVNANGEVTAVFDRFHEECR
jgi:hypothetical protein